MTSTELTTEPQVQQRHGTLSNALFYVLMTLIALTFFFPFVWAISTSLKTPPELLQYPPRLLPVTAQWRNYAIVFQRVPFWLWTGNTLYVVVLGTVGQVITASIAAYAFARFEFRGRDLIFVLTLATLLLPEQVTMIPTFILFHTLGWINTLKPLWVPAWFGGGAFSIFLMRQFLMQLPRELDEAAIIDGAGSFRIYWQLLMPLSKPVLATLAVISIIGRWNDYFGPLIYLHQQTKFTLSVGLTFFRRIPEGGLPTEHYLMAASTMMTLPLIVLFFSAQRYFVQGIALTGIKG